MGGSRAVTDKAPNPGSDEAIELGCKCPVLDNSHGRGYMGQPGIFMIAGGCPLHHLPGDSDSDSDSA